MSTMMASDTTVPLTTTQKMWLARKFLPVIFFALVLIFAVTVLPNILSKSLPPIVPIFLILILLYLIYEASKSLRDLMSGVAVVEVDELVRLSRAARGGNNTHFATFAQLGHMQLSRQAFHQGNMGQQYRVIYSPASRIVWSLEPK